MDINNNKVHNEEQQAMLPISVIDNNVLATDLLFSVLICGEVNKVKISNLAVAAAEELQQMAQEEENKEEPLWLFDEVQNSEVLSVAEYQRRFISIDETLEELLRVIAMRGDSMIMDGLSFRDCGGGFSGKNISRFTVDRETACGVLRNEDASRAAAVVYADPLRLVLMLMNAVIHTHTQVYIYIYIILTYNLLFSFFISGSMV